MTSSLTIARSATHVAGGAMRSTSVAPDLSSAISRVSDTVSTAIFSGTNGRLLVDAGHVRFVYAHSRCAAAKVLQADTLPSFKPVVNQRWRCAEEPWVKASGTT